MVTYGDDRHDGISSSSSLPHPPSPASLSVLRRRRGPDLTSPSPTEVGTKSMGSAPARIDSSTDDGMGIVWPLWHSTGTHHGRRLSSPARCRGPERRRGMWWHRSQQRMLHEGLDFAQDSQGDNDNDFEFIPSSDEEGGLVGLNSAANGDDEVVPETEPQFLVAMESSAMVDTGLGVDANAETNDEFIRMEVKNETNKEAKN